MPDIATALVKYLFLDIVRYTQHRSVEAQSDLIDVLNKIVSSAVESRRDDFGEVIYLPTGDGMAIALLDAKPYDIHLEIGLCNPLILLAKSTYMGETIGPYRAEIRANPT